MSTPRPSAETKILVADDDETFLKWLTAFLTRHGYGCEGAPDAHTALELLAANEFDLLIADINMPGNNDLQLVKEAPKVKQGLPVILVTGQPTVDSAVRSVQMPVAAYLVKPFQGEELLRHIESCLARSQIYMSIERTRSRLDSWQRDLSSIEDLLKLKPDTYSESVPVETFITLTVQNILEPLFDLKHLAETLSGKAQARQNACDLFRCPRLDAHSKMLGHTIETLEHTKNSFKSKELGELRKKLEKFVQVVE